MKATGIVRRIDDLGRVVIPKEIRRTMRIREGEPLEIFTESGGSVILKKYSPVGEQNQLATQLCESISKTSSKGFAICDRDSIIAVSAPQKKELEGKAISSQLDELMQSRQTQSTHQGVTVALNVPHITASVVAPIISGGDLCGCVAVLSGDQPAGELETKLAQTAALFLAKQMED